MSEQMTPEQVADSVIHPERWELHRKGTRGPDTTRLQLEGMQRASGLIQQALRAQGVPEAIRATLQEALDALMEVESKTSTVPETLAALSRNQSRMDAKLSRREEVLGQLLSRSVPTPLPRPEELSGRTIRRVMRKIDSDVQAAHENITDAAIRHHIQAEIERAKRG